MAIRVTAVEVLQTLALDAANDLAALNDKPHYNAQGNHDATHRRQDLESAHAIRVVSKAETVLRLVAGLVSEPEQAGDDNKRTRYLITPTLLREVAAAVDAEQSGKPTLAVAEALSTSHRNATRLIARARAEGYLKA